MQAALTPTASAAGDLMNDAEWFHFDTLWENWAPGTSGAPGPPNLAAVTDPALFNDNPLQNFDGAGGSAAFVPPEIPTDGRFNGGGIGGGMQVPLFPLMRFND